MKRLGTLISDNLTNQSYLISNAGIVRNKSSKSGSSKSKSHGRIKSRSRTNRNLNYGKNFISGIEEIDDSPEKIEYYPPIIDPNPSFDEIKMKINKLRASRRWNPLQQLTKQDCKERVKFANSVLALIETNPEILEVLFFSDESSFRPAPPVTTISPSPFGKGVFNLIIKDGEPAMKELPALVWCAMNKKHVMGPYFYYNYLTEHTYTNIIKNFFVEDLKTKDYDIKTTWFQQDGAPPHRSKRTLKLLKQTFGNRLFSWGTTPYPWPARSQDLNPLDYFLWDYLKVRLLPYHATTNQELRDCLANEIQVIDPSFLSYEIDSFKIRLQKCVEANGARFYFE